MKEIETIYSTINEKEIKILEEVKEEYGEEDIGTPG